MRADDRRAGQRHPRRSTTIGVFGVAFAFGLALLAMAYTIGHVSGCHINPAVTLGFWLSRKITLVAGGVLLGRPGGRARSSAG